MTTQKKEKQRHLGRGLESLLGPITIPEQDGNLGIPIAEVSPKPLSGEGLRANLLYLNVDEIKANPYQPRANYSEEALAELAESIRTSGLIQPLVVRQAIEGFEVIAGERRLRAAKMAGLKSVPAIVRRANDEQMLELALIENIHRADLNPIERAKAYKRYIEEFSLTQAEVAERVGEDRSAVANYVRLLDLPEEIRQMLRRGDISMGHARAILGLPTDELRRKLADRALAARLSVREVERLVRRWTGGGVETPKAQRHKPPHILDLESKLTASLGTRVAIATKRGGHKGKIVIEFYSLEDFDRIAERLGIESTGEI